jgi:hypothetical protein
MTDFFTRLANRTLGLTPKVRPVIPSRFASQSDRGGISEHWSDDFNTLLLSSEDALSPAPQSTPVSSSDVGMAAQTKSSLASNLSRSADTTIVNPVIEPTLGVNSALKVSSSEAFSPAQSSIPTACDRANQGSESVPYQGLGELDRSESQAFTELASSNIRPQMNESEVLSEPVKPAIEPPRTRVSDRSDTFDFPASSDSPTRSSSNDDLLLRSHAEKTTSPDIAANSSSTTQSFNSFPERRQESSQISSVRSLSEDILQPSSPTNSSSSTQPSTSFPEGRQESSQISSVRSHTEDIQQPSSPANSSSTTQPSISFPEVRRENYPISSVRSHTEDIQQPSSSANSSSTQLSTSFSEGRQESYPISSVRSHTEDGVQPATLANSVNSTQSLSNSPVTRRENEPLSSPYGSDRANLTSPTPIPNQIMGEHNIPFVTGEGQNERLTEQYQVLSQPLPTESSASPVFPASSTSTTQQSANSSVARRNSNQEFLGGLPAQMAVQPSVSLNSSHAKMRRESNQELSVRSHTDTTESVIPHDRVANVSQSLEFPRHNASSILSQDEQSNVTGNLEPQLPKRSLTKSTSMIPHPPLVNSHPVLTRSFPELDNPVTSEATAMAQPLSRQQSRLLQVNAQRADWTNSLNPDSLLSPSSTESPPTIQVTIGRVEVRASSPPPPPRPQSPRRSSSLSLNDYLQQRNGK